MSENQTYDEMLAEIAKKLCTRTGKKRQAQEMLMQALGNVLGYWTESDAMVCEALGGEDSKAAEEFHAILKREADRIAKIFGFEEAWGN